MDQPKPVGIWIRVSTEDQALGDSPEYHEKRARLYAEAKEWKVREVYHLEAVSGKSVMQHPEAQRMLQDMSTGHITGLIFSKLARLARNTRELLDFSEIFREHDADLISLHEAIDTSTPAGRLFYTMIAAMAQWEREEIAERVAASVPIRAKLGKPLGGQAPFGYQWNDGHLIPDPNEAPVRKLMYELFLEHRRRRTVARLLNEAGYRTRKGARFSGNTVDRLLRDPTAKGIRRANYTKSLGDGKKWELKPESDWVLLEVEPIISEDLWNQCNAILDEQSKMNKRPSRKTVHLFSGLIFCHCGQKMYVPSGSRKYTCYKCRNKIEIADMEELFHYQLQSFYLSDDEISSHLNKANQVLQEKQELLENLQQSLQSVGQQMDRVYQAYIDDELTTHGFGSRYNPLEQRYLQLQEHLPDLQAEIDFMKIQHLSSDEIISEARDLYARWPQLTESEKRSIVENITERIVIGQDEVVINLSYLPAPSETATKALHNPRVASPFCGITLRAMKPVASHNPDTLTMLGDHIRKRRLDLGLYQKDVARRLGVTTDSVGYWENNRNQPSLRMVPRITEFLSYVPNVDDRAGEAPGQWIVRSRRALGLRQKDLTLAIGVDPTTLARWERGEREPGPSYRIRIDAFLGHLEADDTDDTVELRNSKGKCGRPMTNRRLNNGYPMSHARPIVRSTPLRRAFAKPHAKLHCECQTIRMRLDQFPGSTSSVPPGCPYKCGTPNAPSGPSS